MTNTIAKLHSTLDRFLINHSVSDVLDRLLNREDERELARVDSYFHHNGFTVIDLTNALGTSQRLRLHVWWPQTDRRTDHIHTHPWHFVSHVLIGSLYSEYFIGGHNGVHYKKYTCFSRPERAGYFYNLVGRETLVVSSTQRVQRGQTYSLKRTEKHRVIGDVGKITLTVVSLGQYMTRRSAVYYEDGESPPRSSPNNYFDAPSFVDELKKLGAML